MTSTHQPPGPMRRWGAELTTFLKWVVFSCIIGVVVGAVGAVLTCIAALVPGKKDKSETVAA